MCENRHVFTTFPFNVYDECDPLCTGGQSWQWSVGHGSWVMGQMGQQIWTGHVGHRSVPVTHWPTSH